MRNPGDSLCFRLKNLRFFNNPPRIFAKCAAGGRDINDYLTLTGGAQFAPMNLLSCMNIFLQFVHNLQLIFTCARYTLIYIDMI